MWFFKQARDYYTAAPVSQQLAWQIGFALLFLVLAFIGFHLFRRAFRRPVYADNGTPPPPGAKALERFNVGGRMYHWGIFLIISLLVLSGASFFFPGDVFSIRNTLGFSWLIAHVVLGWLFVLFVLIHMLFAIFDTGLTNMAFHHGDGQDFTRRIRFYLGGRNEFLKHGKFDVFQKLYHVFLVIAAFVMIITGIALFLSSEVIMTFDGSTMRLLRLFHDSFTFLFVAAIFGHIYMRLLRARREKLRSMISGDISPAAFVQQHDWNQWSAREK